MAADLGSTSRASSAVAERADRWNDTPDPDLLDAARAGANGAVAELYRRHAVPLRRFAGRFCRGDLSAADDLVAEAFANLLRLLNDGRGPTDNPLTYLRTAVRNLAATRDRSGRRGQRAYARHGVLTVDTHEPFQITDPDLIEAFTGLPARWREAIWRTEIEGWGCGEIAEELDISPNAASALSYRARQALRRAYETASLAERAAG